MKQCQLRIINGLLNWVLTYEKNRSNIPSVRRHGSRPYLQGCGNCRKEKIGHRKPDGGHTDAETEKVKGEKACEERRILYHLSGSGKM